MAKTVVADPINLGISGRQSISEENHIDRIRSANSKQQPAPFWTAKTDDAVPVKIRLSRRQSSSEENHINRIRSANSEQEVAPVWIPKTDDAIPVKVRLSRRQSSSEENHINRIRSKNSKQYPTPFWVPKTDDAVPVNVKLSRRQSSYEKNHINRIHTANSNQQSFSLEKIDNSVPLKVGLTSRQSISEANHIDRIRTANSRRPSDSFIDKLNPRKYSDVSKEDLDLSKENREKRGSLSDINRTRKAGHNSISRELLEYKHNLDNNHRVNVKRKKSSQNPDNTRNQATDLKQNLKAGTYKSRKINTVKNNNKENVEKPRKVAISHKQSIVSDKSQTKQKVSGPIPKTELTTSIKKERLKKDDQPFESSVQTKKFDFKNEQKELPGQKKNNSPKNPIISKEDIILNWIQGQNSCLATSHSSEMNSSPVRILQKPTETSTNKSEDFPDASKSLELETKSPTVVNEKSIASNRPEMQEAEKGSTGVSTEELADVEMYVSELGKLQIIINAKVLSPEAAAIIIWVDDVPGKFFVPDYHRRLSLGPTPDLQPSESTNQSATKLKDIAIPKANIYFPHVTILKNLAVKSKTGLEAEENL